MTILQSTDDWGNTFVGTDRLLWMVEGASPRPCHVALASRGFYIALHRLPISDCATSVRAGIIQYTLPARSSRRLWKPPPPPPICSPRDRQGLAEAERAFLAAVLHGQPVRPVNHIGYPPRGKCACRLALLPPPAASHCPLLPTRSTSGAGLGARCWVPTIGSPPGLLQLPRAVGFGTGVPWVRGIMFVWSTPRFPPLLRRPHGHGQDGPLQPPSPPPPRGVVYMPCHAGDEARFWGSGPGCTVGMESVIGHPSMPCCMRSWLSSWRRVSILDAATGGCRALPTHASLACTTPTSIDTRGGKQETARTT